MGVITDDRLIVVLAGFESRVDRVLQQIRDEHVAPPVSELPASEPPAHRRPARTASPSRRAAALRAVHRAGREVGHRAADPVVDRFRGDRYPGGPGWSGEPAAQRAHWWVSRIATWAAGPAALPWVAGKLSDRLPIKDALSAAAQGLVVCAVSREYGVEDADRRVSLLAEVLTGRRIDPAAVAAVRSARTLPSGDDAEPPADLERDIAAHVPAERRGVVGRAGRSLWSLARGVREVQSLFDGRQRGNLAARGLGMLPVVGVLGGYVAERSALSRAGRRTEELLSRRFGIQSAGG